MREDLVALFYDNRDKQYVPMGPTALAFGHEVGYGDYECPINAELLRKVLIERIEIIKQIETGQKKLTDYPRAETLVKTDVASLHKVTVDKKLEQ